MTIKSIYRNSKNKEGTAYITKSGKQWHMVKITATDGTVYRMRDFDGWTQGWQQGQDIDLDGFKQEPGFYAGQSYVELTSEKKFTPTTTYTNVDVNLTVRVQTLETLLKELVMRLKALEAEVQATAIFAAPAPKIEDNDPPVPF